MDNFELNEQKGRQLLTSFLKNYTSSIYYTQDKYDPVDVFFSIQGKNAVGEIKVRAKKYQGFSTHIIELGKLIALEKAYKEHNLKYGFYFNFFGEDVLYIYSIQDIRKYGWNCSGFYNHTTAEPSILVSKQMVHIPTRYATKFFLKDGLWQKSE